MSTLYMTATPIGNLQDITLRALDVLKQVDVVACEDTRHTGRLLQHFGVKAKLIACHARNEQQSAQGIIKLLEQGKEVAYVSDAGTPGISDPGNRLVKAVREAGFSVVPIPGVSAMTALVSVASYTGKTITFEGFLSPKGGRRRRRIDELIARGEGFVLYESPYRLVKTLKDIAEAGPNRRVLVGRELTKLHEECLEQRSEELYRQFAERPAIKGECVIFVSPPEGSDNDNH